jgi:hypothetical protein
MMQGLHSFHPDHYGYHHLAQDADERRLAQKMFDKARAVAQRRALWARLTGQPRAMRPLAADTGTLRYRGVQTVRLADIIGTENRSREFDSEFYPLAEHIEQRWLSVAIARLKQVTLPPVILIRAADGYYVRDGHHRLSVARLLGQMDIEAEVLVLAADRAA